MNLLRKFREERGLSQREVGDYLGITGQAYSNYENERRKIDTEMLLKLGELYGATIEQLLGYGSGSSEFDSFTYAMHQESGHLTEDQKAALLNMARLFRSHLDEDASGSSGK